MRTGGTRQFSRVSFIFILWTFPPPFVKILFLVGLILGQVRLGLRKVAWVRMVLLDTVRKWCSSQSILKKSYLCSENNYLVVRVSCFSLYMLRARDFIGKRVAIATWSSDDHLGSPLLTVGAEARFVCGTPQLNVWGFCEARRQRWQTRTIIALVTPRAIIVFRLAPPIHVITLSPWIISFAVSSYCD